jgi:hypothetical protein
MSQLATRTPQHQAEVPRNGPPHPYRARDVDRSRTVSGIGVSALEDRGTRRH